MEPTDPVDHVPPSPDRDRQTLQLMIHLFKGLLKEEDISPDEGALLLPEYFLAWLREKVRLGEVTRTALDEAGVGEVAWDFLMEIAHAPAGALQVSPMWPHVVLAYRGRPAHAVASMQAVMLINYEDGTIVPLSSSFYRLILGPGGAISDALAATQMIQMASHFHEALREKGLDALYEQHGSNYDGDRPFEILMGLLLKIIPQLKPELQENARNWMRLIQGVIRPPLPPELKAYMALARQADRHLDQPGNPDNTPRPQGGFDV